MSNGRMHGQNSVRLARNVAEKQRRDRLNSFINDLANSVPLVATATRRLDKTSILRLSAAYLRLHDSPLTIVTSSKSSSSPSSCQTSVRSVNNHHHNNCCNGGGSSSAGGGGVIGVNGGVVFSDNHHIDYSSCSFSNSSCSTTSSSTAASSSPSSSSLSCVQQSGRTLSSYLNGQELQTVMNNLDGFLMVVNSDFKFLYVSSTVEKFLGHQNIDMLGHQLSSFLHPGDLGPVRQAVIDLKTKFLSTGNHHSDRISFRCRMRERAQPRTEVVTYQIVKISGYFVIEVPERENHFSPPDPVIINGSNGSSGSSTSISSNGSIFSPKFLSKNLLFKGFAEIVPANPVLSLMDANQEEYVSRISLDGTLLYADHRISLVLGYMPSEVIGKSAYKFILVSDHVISLFAHKLMLASSNGTGCVVHRLKNRSGGYTYLQSAGCLQYDRYTGKVDHFVNVARMLPETEGKRELDKFIRKFAPHVTSDSPSSLFQSLQMAIAPQSDSPSSAIFGFSPNPQIPFEGQQQQQQQHQHNLQQQNLQQQQQLQQQQTAQTYQTMF